MHPCGTSRCARAFIPTALTLAGAMLAGIFAAAAVAAAPIKMADAFLIENTGKWFCSDPAPYKVTCNPERGSKAVGEALTPPTPAS